MDAGPERVYLDTGDLLVTSRRSAFEGVSVSTAELSAARLVPRPMLRPVRGRELSRIQRVACLLVGVSMLPLAAALAVTFPAAAIVPPQLMVEVYVAGLAVMLLGGVLARRVCPAVVPAPGYAVLLTAGRREVELFRTLDRNLARSAVSAVNRAVAGRQSCR